MHIFIFSSHVLQRMRERNIAHSEILAVLYNKVDVLVYPSTQDTSADMYVARVEEKYIVVVLNRETNVLITVRNLRKNEKKLLEEYLHEK